jgi:hypothetical protein
MSQKGVKMSILWLKQNQWQTCKYGKRILEFTEMNYIFKRRKRIRNLRFGVQV